MLKPVVYLILLFFTFLSFPVFSQKTISYNRNTPNVCPGGNIILNATDAGTNATFAWFKDNITIPNATNKELTVTAVGKYYVKVTTAEETVDYEELEVKAATLPNASFTFNNNNQCAGTTITFTPTDNSPGNNYFWDFGNGNTSQDKTPTQQFDAIGGGTRTFKVKLTVTNADGCSKTEEMDVNVKERPDAKFDDFGSDEPFTNCQEAGSSGSFTLTITNTSSTKSENLNYEIDWGDGSPIFQTANFNTASHEYTQLGSFTIRCKVIGKNGCEAIFTREVFNGSNPAVPYANPGGTQDCGPYTLRLPINSNHYHPPGTKYRVIFSDGSPEQKYDYPPTEIVHTFTKSSCGAVSSGGFQNAFHVRIIAENPCGSSSVTIEPIRVSTKPEAKITASKEKICLDETISFTNNSLTGYIINANGSSCSSTTKTNWTISPSDGWVITSGGLGNPNPNNDPSTWGSTMLNIKFTKVGTYTVRLNTSNNCGDDFIEKIICVNPTPIANFSVDKKEGCAPLAIRTTNLSNTPLCGDNTYQWTVSYSNPQNCTGANSNYTFLNSTNSTSANPEFQFNKAGVYTIRLITRNSDGNCTSTAFTETITVKEKPIISSNTIPSTLCVNETFNPNAIVRDCYTGPSTFLWSFPGANITSSTDANPTGISYATRGSYVVTLSVTNDCGTTTITKNITVNAPPAINPISDRILCRGESSSNINFTNTENNNNVTYSWTNDNTAIGLAASGNKNNIPAFIATNTGNTAITANITVTPILNGCNGTPMTFKITVNPSAPTANAGQDQKLCNATEVQLSGNIAGNSTGKWTLISGQAGISFDDNTLPNAKAFGLQPDQEYEFLWTINGFNPCPSTSDAVKIINRPSVTTAVAGNNATVCDRTNTTNNSFTLQANTPRSFETGVWTIVSEPAGSNASFSNANSPKSSIRNLIAGTYQLKWAISNDACSSPSENTVTLEVFERPAAGTLSGLNNVCIGSDFTLTYANGTGKILGWQESIDNAQWTDIANTENQTSLSITNYTSKKWFRVKIGSLSNSCTNVIYSNIMSVDVDPITVGGTLSMNGTQTFCSTVNNGTLTLSGHTGNVVRWESSTDNVSFNTIINSNSVTYTFNNLSAATTYFRAVVKSGDCAEEYSSAVTIIVNPSAPLANAGTNQILCEATETTLNGNNPGSFPGKWTLISGDADLVFENDTKYNTKITGLKPGQTYQLRWTIEGINPCPETNDDVTIINRPAITNANAGTDAIVCDIAPTNRSYTLSANSPQPFENGQWTIVSQPGGSNASFLDASSPSSTIQNLVAGTYQLQWTIRNNDCNTSSNDIVELEVFDYPVAGNISGANNICINTTLQLSYSGGVGKILAWQESADGNTWADIPNTENENSLNVDNYSTKKWYRLKIGSNGPATCNTVVYSSAKSVEVNALSVGGTINGAKTVCIGNNNGTLQLSGQTGDVIRWELSTDQSSWAPVSNSNTATLSFSNLGITTYYRALVQSGACSTEYSDTVTITVLPEVDIANAGQDIYLCDYKGIIHLDANIPVNGSGTWVQKSGPAIALSDPNDPKTEINITQTGKYVFEWVISNGICDPSVSTITIFNSPPLTNSITGTATYCYGQTVAIIGDSPTGGNDTYTYRWETSNDNNNWLALANETNVDLSFIASQTLYVRRVVQSGPCELASSSVLITVQNPITNNTLSQNQEVCIDNPIEIITGSHPVGGDGIFTYVWQYSADGNSWQNIAGATHQDFQPVNLSSTTYFRRIVSTALCKEAQQSISNIVKVTIYPDAKAEFAASNTVSCLPFDLSTVITSTPYTDRNGNYEWFANGVSIGTGINFPGYTIHQDGEQVNIKLVAYSKFGCKDDEMEISFSTVKNVTASFTKDKVKDCGPLTVNFTNTSTPLSGGNYIWDFGNGITSTDQQPAAVTFQPHPLNRDTTYIITLKAITPCFETVFVDSVIVRPTPVSIFSPDKTIGCSPLEINFTNHSRGMPNTYTIDFGNGDQITRTDNEPFSYTFHTLKTDTFTVKFYAINECGIDSSSYDIVVYPNTITPELVVDGTSAYGCAPFTVKFDNNFKGANSFLWDFNDGTTATSYTVPGSMTHTFTNPGTYTVKLTGTNGCSTASTTETIVVYPPPVANFSTDKLQYCVNEKVSFNNLSQGPYSFVWDFGNGQTSNAIQPEFAFTASGIYTITLTVSQTFPDGTTCSTSFTKQVEILTQPNAIFTTNANTLNCAPFTLVVNATPANSSGGVEWHFQDPNSSDTIKLGYTSSHTFTAPGLYKVTAIAYNQSGCADSLSQYIRVTETPLAFFEASETMICAPSASVIFSNKTTYNGAGSVGYRWFVNNTLVSTQKDLTYTFNTPQNVILPHIFEVKLVATSTIGCSDTTIQSIQLNPLPKADFSISKLVDCPPFNLTISNNSGYADDFKWYVDNQLVSTEKTPDNIILRESGKTFQLKLVASNSYACKVDSMVISVNTYAKPLSSFIAAENTSCNGKLDLSVTNNSTGANAYIWDFGDGSPVSTAAVPKHTYTSPGVYKLSLIAFNGLCYDTSSVNIQIAAPPKASFVSNTTNGCTKVDITFQNLSDNAISYLWDFGDGTFSGSKNPTHAFSYHQSPFTVKLIAFGQFGCADTTIMVNHINISRPPKANFEVLPDTVISIPNYTFTFKNTSEDGAQEYLWDFGNGRISKDENPIYTYPDTGSYKVRLIAFNKEGCTDTLVRTVRVDGVPAFLYVPNAFEPSGNKEELRTFKVRGSGIAVYTIRIFNKWGEVIWESDKLDDKGVPIESWDGTMKGLPAPQGVYIWDIYAKFLDGTEWKGMKYEKGTRKQTGPIHLIR